MILQLAGVAPALLVLGAGLLEWVRWRRRVGSRARPPSPAGSGEGA